MLFRKLQYNYHSEHDPFHHEMEKCSWLFIYKENKVLTGCVWEKNGPFKCIVYKPPFPIHSAHCHWDVEILNVLPLYLYRTKNFDTIKPQNYNARLLKRLFPSENGSLDSYHSLMFNAGQQNSWVPHARLTGITTTTLSQTQTINGIF